ncbi:MAG: right-handed parallel beta-helix repeat-containing protein [Bacteroidota bacterium]
MTLRNPFLILGVLIISVSCTKEYHVSREGDDLNKGSSMSPFRTISKAAEVAQPGDVITVHEGIYRERVNPPRGGSSDQHRIVYQAAEGEKVEIKGSEVISGWESLGKGIWTVTIPNSLFGDHNPFEIEIAGDWLVDGGWNHTGEVYLNGKSLYEAETLEGVMEPVPHERSLDKEAAMLKWYARVDENETTIWANFNSEDPNRELVEIHVRETCFYPDAPGRNYITVDGFHMNQSATQWAPPSAEQVGLMGTHWSKGWIIQNCIIHDSKCSGITLGKDRKSGHNGWEPGTSGADHYNRIIIKALEGSGWSKENIGSHVVRNNTIYDCEQTGICGSMGPVYSEITGNHIHHIWTKRQFFGYEIAAIKFHAPIDVLIKNNRLHDAHKGIWVDWMTQGTRISGNICYNNEMADLFAEVNHGPYLVDNNLFLSAIAIQNWSEGGAYVHNLIAGEIRLNPVTDRTTPYHHPHTTTILGMSITTLGDDRFFNNIFVAPADSAVSSDKSGLNVYNLMDIEHPVYINHNVYYGLALPFDREEKNAISTFHETKLDLVEKRGDLYLEITLDDALLKLKNPLINTELLGTSVRTGSAWENPDGSPVQIDFDFFGTERKSLNPSAGPFESIGSGVHTLQVWRSGKEFKKNHG